VTARGVLRRGVVLALGVVWLVPLYLLVVNAARPPSQDDLSQLWRLPSSFGLLDNLLVAWNRAGLGSSIASTFLYSLVAPALAVVVGACAGFAISVLRLRHGFAWFVFVFGGTIFPVQMLMAPLFIGYSIADLYDTRHGLVLIYTAVNVPFAALVMRNFFTNVSHSLYEAATIDGASTWSVFWRIFVPVSASALVAIFILEFTLTWNDLLFGLTLSATDTVRPVMTALSSLQSAYSGTTAPDVLAAALVVSLPTIVVFLVAQRFFRQGLALGQL
jgi:multiple sugar transport system permease protein